MGRTFFLVITKLNRHLRHEKGNHSVLLYLFVSPWLLCILLVILAFPHTFLFRSHKWIENSVRYFCSGHSLKVSLNFQWFLNTCLMNEVQIQSFNQKNKKWLINQQIRFDISLSMMTNGHRNWWINWQQRHYYWTVAIRTGSNVTKSSLILVFNVKSFIEVVSVYWVPKNPWNMLWFIVYYVLCIIIVIARYRAVCTKEQRTVGESEKKERKSQIRQMPRTNWMK